MPFSLLASYNSQPLGSLQLCTPLFSSIQFINHILTETSANTLDLVSASVYSSSFCWYPRLIMLTSAVTRVSSYFLYDKTMHFITLQNEPCPLTPLGPAKL
ncbi:hypothetical protein ILYODFUR_024032 [Ilyodon furcidens]|uniref:Uncharacterized protein n=1 Tax=Ilyodon furcidens TaxID=33524 RepID=A0ABV0UJ69_9TELE